MANSLIFDPISQQQSAIVAGFLSTTAVTLLFVTDTHHLLIRAIVDSYSLFQPGIVPNTADTLHLIARQVSDSFKIGVQFAAPFLVVSMSYYLVLGILTRLSPQIPIFFVAMPAQIVISIVVLSITISSIMLAFLNHVHESLTPFIVL